MNNFTKPGKILTFTAPTGGVTGGVPVIIGDTFVIPMVTAAATKLFEGIVEEVAYLPKATGVAWTEGSRVYWDPANLVCSTVPTVGPCIGIATRTVDNAVATSGATHGYVKLLPIPADAGGGTAAHQARFRVALSDVNAGLTLLPAIPGKKYRVVDAIVIAIGGAMGALTAVILQGTQAASVVTLDSVAQANLTQSAVNRMGASGSTVLADGASFADCDANTAITIGKTGSAGTTATFVDVVLTYAME